MALQTSPIGALHQRSGSSRAGGPVSWLTSGAKAEPAGFRTGSWRPESTRASTLSPSSRQEARVSGSPPEASWGAASHPARPHLQFPGKPGAALPRHPRPRESWKSRSRDRNSNGAAGNWPLDFLRPTRGRGWPVGGTRKPRLPPSCFRPGEFKPSLPSVW
ncbi:small integral membrane protein 15 isoform X1 [Ailuropoda melanoleuca]|uniref:small integral membrane protein 15 isoform X1 n=1 Tax=Ailuropoda melanoleuca TaxID=9646 RepID=UPI0014945683|nr:small integral membrane protein 15 isoform X1 [Ailuropoda melanoleuca]